ncbi:MAG: hypothetical protein AB1521_10110 [Bacteroidota bacterium]
MTTEEIKENYHPPFILNQFYHIYNKSVTNNLLFYSDENYRYFLKRYKYFLNDVVNTYAFCLLPNHFHFLIMPIIDDPLTVSKQFQRLFISYSMALNKQKARKGNLFQKNFKRRIVYGEESLKNLVYYIHTNPSHHMIDSDYQNYPFSSYRIIVSRDSTTLKREEVLDWFGGIQNFINKHVITLSEVVKKLYEIEE